MLRVMDKKWRYENNAVEEGKLGKGVAQENKREEQKKDMYVGPVRVTQAQCTEVKWVDINAVTILHCL